MRETRPVADATRVQGGSVPVGKRYLTEAQLATYAALSVRTLQAWRLRRIGPPFVKLPTGAIRYRLDEYDIWAASGAEGQR